MEELTLKSNSNKELLKLPSHIAIIMDGNRRWAKNKNIPTPIGHSEGVKTLKKITRYASEVGVKHLTVYAFSTENWNRKKEEVDFLMQLIKDSLLKEIKELHEEGVKLKFLGFIKDLPGNIPELLQDAEIKTKNNSKINLNIAINYGSRMEITNTVKEIALKVKSNEIQINDITPELISQFLLTKDIPEPELLIRTGGELRISNYLLWQCAYTEFYSTNTLWPDFNEKDLTLAIEEFNRRQRRFGT